MLKTQICLFTLRALKFYSLLFLSVLFRKKDEESNDKARTKCEDATKTSETRKMTAPYALRQISLKASGATRDTTTHSATWPGTQCPTRAERSPIRPHISPGDKRLPDDDGKYSGFGDMPDRRFIAQLHPVPRNNSAAETKRNCTSHRYLFTLFY